MKKIFFLFFSLIILIVLAGFSFLYLNNQPVSSDKTNITIVLNNGDGLRDISQKLKTHSLIRSDYTFLFYAHYLGLNNKLQAGTFRLSQSLSTKDIIIKISKGGISDYWLKIIDGTRVEELATNFPTDLSFTGKDFVSQTKNYQGYLFPDSYLIPKYFTIDQILSTIQTNFTKKFTQAKIGATNTQMTDKQIVILASIIEREARTLPVKQGVAGVLINRINAGIPLQSDVTVQFIRDSKTKPIDYWKDISAADISIVSPYNTYKNKGLPPGPICNPGYDSLYAAFHPTTSDYLFYLTGNDGVMHYATTLAEHNANIAKYLK